MRTGPAVARQAPVSPAMPLHAAPAYALPAFVCIVGLVLRLLLSAPVLNIVGIDYGGEDASLLFKVHPGSWLVILSFALLLASGPGPFAQLFVLARRCTAYFGLFVAYVAILIYWAVRGPKGIGLILDIHIVAPMAAMVLTSAPRRYLRGLMYGFVAIAVANSVIGLGEAAMHGRLFPYDPSWEVLNQDYFRATALMGHPLNNALFTAVALFLMLGTPLRLSIKLPAFALMLASMIAFGGRSALIFGLLGLSILGLTQLVARLRSGRLSLRQNLMLVLGAIFVPLFSIGLLGFMLTTSAGERLVAYNSLKDDSADVRMQTLHTLNYLSPAELIFGVDGDRITEVANRAGLVNPTSDIENPWLLMFMFLGAIMFALWIAGLALFVWRLMRGASPAVKGAVVVYFLIASTSNSFGRKDPVFLIMTAMVVCIKIMVAGKRA